jgi:hypothetical protein
VAPGKSLTRIEPFPTMKNSSLSTIGSNPFGTDKGLCYTHLKKKIGCKAYVHIPTNGGSIWMKSHRNAFSWNMLIMS